MWQFLYVPAWFVVTYITYTSLVCIQFCRLANPVYWTEPTINWGITRLILSGIGWIYTRKNTPGLSLTDYVIWEINEWLYKTWTAAYIAWINNALMYMSVYIHIHTHTHIYIYVYICELFKALEWLKRHIRWYTFQSLLEMYFKSNQIKFISLLVHVQQYKHTVLSTLRRGTSEAVLV